MRRFVEEADRGQWTPTIVNPEAVHTSNAIWTNARTYLVMATPWTYNFLAEQIDIRSA